MKRRLVEGFDAEYLNVASPNQPTVLDFDVGGVVDGDRPAVRVEVVEQRARLTRKSAARGIALAQ